MREGSSFARAVLAATLITGFALPLGGCGGDDTGNGPPTGPPGPPKLSVSGGGNNVPERFTSDLWVYGNHAYTGTYGGSRRLGHAGDALKIWSLDGTGAPSLTDSIIIPEIGTVSDVEVSRDGLVLMLSAERGLKGGLYLYDLTDPVAPVFLDSALVATGLHTATFGEIDGRRYAFTAKYPPDPALKIYDITDPAAITAAATVPIPPAFGIHDTYVRDGLVFVFAWNTGVIIYDVGNGIRGGSPASPVEVSRLATGTNEIANTPAVHNGWWFHNPVTQEARYLFVGQEGPILLGTEASGDIHVVDVSDLAAPREVASFRLPHAGTHNFWMDEDRQVLYAAYYNGGVVALDVSGTLSGDLSNRLIDRIEPGGADNTFVWGVQLANGSLYLSDMLSGLWQIALE